MEGWKDMNVLFYIEPWIERKKPGFRLGSFLEDLPIKHFLSQKEHDLRFIAGEAVAFYLKNNHKRMYQAVKDNLLIVPEAELRKFNKNYLTAQVDIFQNNLSVEQKEGYKNLYGELLKDFLPDVIISWESPSQHLQAIFPDALILNQYHNSLLRFSNEKWTDRYIFDPSPLQSSVMVDVIRNIEDVDVENKFIKSIKNVKEEYIDRYSLDTYYKNIIEEYKKTYNKIMLLPLQGSHFNFEGNSRFHSQFDFVLHVLEHIDSSVGILVTEHHLLYGDDLTDENIKYLQKNYPNFIYSQDFRVPHISTRFLPFSDGVITVSSSLAWSARLLNKHVCVCGDSWYKEIATVKFEDIQHANEEAEDIDKVLAYFLYYFSITYKDFQDYDYLVSYIADLHCKFKNNIPKPLWFKPKHSAEELISSDIDTIQEVDDYPTHYKRFFDEIKSSKIVSFDIFDTLLQRNVLFPTDVFKLMSREVSDIVGAPVKFKELRVLAEIEANKASPEDYEDVNLDEIYLYLQQYGFSEEQSEKIKQIEIAWEKKLLVPRETGRKLFERAKKLDKVIIIVSDMYLPKHILEDILKANGYTGYHKLYVSSETRTKKHTGSLFAQILEELNVNARDVVHIGDNSHGDIAMAKQYDIRTLHIRASLYNFFLSEPAKALWPNRQKLEELSVFDRCALALIINRYFESPWESEVHSLFNNSYYRAGYFAFGPLVFDMTAWLYKNAKKNNHDGMLFIWRDGYIPEKIWHKLDECYDEKIKTKAIKLYGSRSIYTHWLLHKNPVTLLDYNHFDKGANIQSLLKSWFNLDIPQDKVKDLFGISRILSKDDLLKKLNIVLENSGAEIKKEADNLSYYYKQETEAYNNLALFDIGYRGRSQSVTSYITQKEIEGYYLAIFEESALPNEKMNMHAYLTESIRLSSSASWSDGYNPILELAISDPKASVRNILVDDEGQISFKFKQGDISPNHQQQIEMQQGILDFTRDFVEAFGNEVPYMQMSKNYTSKPLQYLCYAKKDYDLWSQLLFPNDISLVDINCGEFYVKHHFSNKQFCLVYGANNQEDKELNHEMPRGFKRLFSKEYIKYKKRKILARRFNYVKPVRPTHSGLKKYIQPKYYSYAVNKFIYRLVK